MENLNIKLTKPSNKGVYTTNSLWYDGITIKEYLIRRSFYGYLSMSTEEEQDMINGDYEEDVCGISNILHLSSGTSSGGDQLKFNTYSLGLETYLKNLPSIPKESKSLFNFIE